MDRKQRDFIPNIKPKPKIKKKVVISKIVTENKVTSNEAGPSSRPSPPPSPPTRPPPTVEQAAGPSGIRRAHNPQELPEDGGPCESIKGSIGVSTETTSWLHQPITPGVSVGTVTTVQLEKNRAMRADYIAERAARKKKKAEMEEKKKALEKTKKEEEKKGKK